MTLKSRYRARFGNENQVTFAAKHLTDLGMLVGRLRLSSLEGSFARFSIPEIVLEGKTVSTARRRSLSSFEFRSEPGVGKYFVISNCSETRSMFESISIDSVIDLSVATTRNQPDLRPR